MDPALVKYNSTLHPSIPIYIPLSSLHLAPQTNSPYLTSSHLLLSTRRPEPLDKRNQNAMGTSKLIIPFRHVSQSMEILSLDAADCMDHFCLRRRGAVGGGVFGVYD